MPRRRTPIAPYAPLLIALAAAPAPLALAPTPALAARDELQDRLNAGAAANTAKEWDKAIAEFKAALTIDPKNTTALMNLGYAYYFKDDNAHALESYSAALALIPTAEKTLRARAFTNRGDTYRYVKEYQKAYSDASDALRSAPDYPFAWRLRAELRYLMGDLTGARDDMAEGTRLKSGLAPLDLSQSGADANLKANPEIYRAAFDAAVALGNAREFALARSLYDSVLRTHPHVPGAYINRAVAHFYLKDYDRAVADFTSCIDECGDDGKFKSLKFDALIARSEVYRTTEALDKALADGDSAIALSGDSARAWEQRAVIRYTRGDYDGAVADDAEARKRDSKFPTLTLTRDGAAANAARRIDPNDPNALIGRARATLARALAAPDSGARLALRQQTSDDLDRALQLAPGRADAWVLRGQAQEVDPLGLRLGPDESALPFYDKAIAADPRHADAYWRRARLRLGLLLPDASVRALAAADLDKALELGVAAAEAFYERAKLRLEKQDDAGALRDLSEAVTKAPDHVDYLQQRAALYERSKDWPHALADRTRLIALDSSARRFAHRGDTYTDAGDFDRAVADFDRAVALDPKDADHVLGRARAYRRKGDRTRALTDYRAAHALDPTVPEVAADLANADAADTARHDLNRALGKIRASLAQVSQAQDELLKAEKAKARSEQRLRRAIVGDKRTPDEILKEVADAIADGAADEQDYLDRARVYAQQDKAALAIADCTKAIALKPGSAEAHNLRGILYENAKELDKALADYDRAVALDGTRATYVRNRGDIHYARNHFADAWTDYEAAVRLDPKGAINYFKRANAAFQRGKIDDALADYDKALELKPNFAEAKRNREIVAKKKSGN